MKATSKWLTNPFQKNKKKQPHSKYTVDESDAKENLIWEILDITDYHGAMKGFIHDKLTDFEEKELSFIIDLLLKTARRKV